MSLWSRILNAIHPHPLHRELDEELESHIAEAMAQGRDPQEARRALGSPLRHREASRDAKLLHWLDSLRSDALFGLRQLRKNKITTAAAILSLALALGACTSAFRLIDALLFRPLPVAHPERLYVVARQGVDPGGHFRISDSNEYPLHVRMRTAVQQQAELIAISYGDRVDVTYSSDSEMEKTHLQYVSGSMFGAFGLQPALGRLFSDVDDFIPRASPYAVLSYDYWTRRFGRDPGVIGRNLRSGNDLLTIIGIAPKGFTGTEPGTITDIFLPIMMYEGVTHSDWSWFRTVALLKPGVSPDLVREKLQPILRAFQEERAKGWSAESKRFLEDFLAQKLLLQPAPSGASAMQEDYRSALIALAVLVGLLLLIACANVANLMLAQAAARAREMALRISIGAGRARLIQLVLVESAWIAFLSAVLGGLFAWWSAPFVVSRINPPDNPARLALSADWRLFAFSVALTFGVAFLFGLAPALRASSITPVSALKGGSDPHSRPRLMYALIAAQVSFCFVVHFVAGLFLTTFDRLTHQSTGFSADRIVVLDTKALKPQPPAVWDQTADALRSVPGVEKVALSGWPLLDGNGWNGFIWVNGVSTETLGYYLAVTPGWLNTMKISLIDGRDFRPDDAFPNVAIVNETFVNQCFHGQNPIGRFFEKETGDGKTRLRLQVIGVAADARYRNMREPITPTAYVPFRSVDAAGAAGTQKSGSFIIRTANANPLALASILRRQVPRARPELRVSNIRTQTEINARHTLRERLLATLALFFATVALLLAAIGLYGVLHYTVLQRHRELGIRIAVGARAATIARLVTTDLVAVILAGAAAGLILALTGVRTIESLLYQVRPTDAPMLALPAIIIIAAAIFAATPAIIRAIRIDPATLLRTD